MSKWQDFTMDDAGFWHIISLLDWSELGDDELVLAPAVDALSEMPLANLEQFAEILARKLYDIDTEAHAEAARFEGYVSDDTFLYARCAAVASGQAAYEEVAQDPSKMPTIEYEFEALLYVAAEIYEEKTGEDFEYDTSVSFETGSNEEQWSKDGKQR